MCIVFALVPAGMMQYEVAAFLSCKVESVGGLEVLFKLLYVLHEDRNR